MVLDTYADSAVDLLVRRDPVPGDILTRADYKRFVDFLQDEGRLLHPWDPAHPRLRDDLVGVVADELWDDFRSDVPTLLIRSDFERMAETLVDNGYLGAFVEYSDTWDDDEDDDWS